MAGQDMDDRRPVNAAEILYSVGRNFPFLNAQAVIWSS
jgi:hypothetical protein